MKSRFLKTIGSKLAILILLSLVAFACADYAKSLGGDWIYDANNLEHPFIRKNGSKEGDPFIPCYVIAKNSNEQFIIAAQQPDTDCRWNEKEAKIADAINKSGHSINFWIIDIAADKLIGPLSLDEYIHQREQLKLPDDLEINVKI